MSYNYSHKLTPKEVSKIPFFYDVTNAELKALSEILEVRVIWENRYIFREGDKQTNMYFILEGAVDVLKQDSKGNEELIARLEPPQVFGEMVLVSGGQRSASVKAVKETVVAELSRKMFEKLIITHPALAVNIIRQIADTLSYKLRKLNMAYVELI